MGFVDQKNNTKLFSLEKNDNRKHPHTIPDLSKYRQYRFWPVYLAALLRTFGFSIYNIALPNYLIYIKHFEPSLIGYISASFGLAYIFGPFLGDKMGKIMGVRNSVFLSALMTTILTAIQIIWTTPFILIFTRIIDGLFLGLFWPNLQLQICEWQDHSSSEMHDTFFKRYTTSWNIGLLGGIFTGFIIVLFGSADMLALYVGWGLLGLIVPVSLFMERRSHTLLFNELIAISVPNEIYLLYSNNPKIINQKPDNLKDINNLDDSTVEQIDNREFKQELMDNVNINSPPNPKFKVGTLSPFIPWDLPDKKTNKILELTAFPIIFSIAGALLFSTLKSSLTFAYPIYLERSGIASAWVYLTYFFQQALQILTIRKITTFSIKIKYKLAIIGLISGILMLIGLSIKLDLVFYIIAMLIGGICVGFIYTMSTQIMFLYGTKTGRSIYTSGYEVLIGFGFGVTPLIAGELVEIQIQYSFLYGAIFAIIWFIILTPILRKYKV